MTQRARKDDVKPLPRGQEPKTLLKWVRATAKDGARRFRCSIAGQKEPKVVAFRNAVFTSKTIEGMGPTECEALDDDGSVLRVWQFAESSEPAADELPGYTVAEGDGENERLLKVFGHLLSDAYKTASKQLVEVVGIQAQHFADERKNLVAMRVLNERLMQQMAKKVARIRIADSGAAEGEDIEDVAATGDDNFLQDFVGPLFEKFMRNKVTGEIRSETAPPPAPANGAKE